MLKIVISEDEWYPCYTMNEVKDESLVSKFDTTVEMSEENYKKFKAIQISFDELQDELERLYREKENG